MIILDTNVLIEVLKNNTDTISTLSELQAPMFVSIITSMELFYGARDKQEVKMLERFLGKFEQLPIDESISYCALDLVQQYAKSHTLDIPDSLIAASALMNQASLFTYNTKDFRFIPEITLVEY
ncbi:type II toxin-antitoxin system VapC family toxin [Leucothrix pacifica]|uniref:VapC toxin family PIN domain ribonuclease n=1 Tax=Leucothrix pacifica TaxID=1247513 RepID=A0A317C1V1_9GAMM|nr:type II toxin-antitoxin system VapC family toxin [Leucothrix pacifica]PWQ92626.1 VapC toxin family PIN domain ribonuclease [Leucothrix pacifica]